MDASAIGTFWFWGGRYDTICATAHIVSASHFMSSEIQGGGDSGIQKFCLELSCSLWYVSGEQLKGVRLPLLILSKTLVEEWEGGQGPWPHLKFEGGGQHILWPHLNYGQTLAKMYLTLMNNLEKTKKILIFLKMISH